MSQVDVKAMMEGMRETLERDQAEGKMKGLSVEDLSDAVAHPKAGEVISELMALDAAGVKQSEPAPDFCLPWLPGSENARGGSMRLSDYFGKRPVALIFGSYT